MSTRTNYSYRCATCKKPVNNRHEALQCAACLVPLCPKDYHLGFCKKHYDQINLLEMVELQHTASDKPDQFQDIAKKVATRCSLAREDLLYNRDIAWVSEPRANMDNVIAATTEQEWIEGTCAICGTPMTAQEARFCRQCGKTVCKHCYKASMLCNADFKQLPTESQHYLLTVQREIKFCNVASIVGLTIFFASIIAIIGYGSKFTQFLPAWLFICYISFIGTLTTAAIFTEAMGFEKYGILRKHGIPIKYSQKEKDGYRKHSFKCAQCGESIGLEKSIHCRICGKEVCVNCSSEARLCPAHARDVSPGEIAVLLATRGHVRKAILGCFLWYSAMVISTIALIAWPGLLASAVIAISPLVPPIVIGAGYWRSEAGARSIRDKYN